MLEHDCSLGFTPMTAKDSASVSKRMVPNAGCGIILDGIEPTMSNGACRRVAQWLSTANNVFVV